MFKATQAIYDELKGKEGLKVFVEENERSSEVYLNFSLERGGGYRIRFISNDDDNDVKVRVYALAKVPKNKMTKVLKLVNQLNSEYRFLKFVVDDDDDLNVCYDFFVDAQRPELTVEVVIMCYVHMIDEVYPQIMSTIWVDDE